MDATLASHCFRYGKIARLALISGRVRKKGDDIREEEDVAAKNRPLREEVNRSGPIIEDVAAFDELKLGELLRMHNDLFCIAAMQQKHGVGGAFLSGPPQK